MINRKSFLHILFLIALTTLQVGFNFQLFRLNSSSLRGPTERNYKLNPQLLRILSFGHLPAWIDWIWILSLADTSLVKVPKGTHPQIFYDIDLVTDLDPYYSEIYPAGSKLLSVIRDDGPGARDILLKAEHFIQTTLPQMPEQYKNQYWNTTWNIPYILGYVYLFDLDDIKNAAAQFVSGSKEPGAPAPMLNLAKRFSVPGGEYEVGLKLLGFMMMENQDTRIRSELEKKRYNLFIGRYLYELNLGFQTFLNSQTSYHHTTTPTEKQMANFWKSFLRTQQIREQDPWGGRLYLDTSGHVASTTPHVKVLGLD